MSEIKTLEDMRNTVKTIAADCDEGWILGCLDAIESEIAERFMPRPCDMDGVPIHVGDELYNGEVIAFGGLAEGGVVFVHRGFEDGNYILEAFASNVTHHVKPRTLENILNDCADEIGEKRGIAPEWNRDTPTRNEIVAKYAAEIRELLGVNE